jgi:hypothetical protein
LEPYTPPDWETRLPIRSLWVACEFWDWFDSKDELHDAARKVGARTLGEHIEMIFCEFRCAPSFPAGELRQMIPNATGVRKLHPPKLRIYGWCPGAHQFVAVMAALEIDTKTDKSLNSKKMDEVLAFIRTHHLEQHVLKGDNRAVFPPRT